jgi:hypothetical protein
MSGSYSIAQWAEQLRLPTVSHLSSSDIRLFYGIRYFRGEFRCQKLQKAIDTKPHATLCTLEIERIRFE